jgi:hypothetical protein
MLERRIMLHLPSNKIDARAFLPMVTVVEATVGFASPGQHREPFRLRNCEHPLMKGARG